jgi:hypothetical protein
MYGYSLNINMLFYITRVKGYGFYERGKRQADMFLGIMILMFCGPPKEEQTEALWKLYMCQKFMIFKTS